MEGLSEESSAIEQNVFGGESSILWQLHNGEIPLGQPPPFAPLSRSAYHNSHAAPFLCEKQTLACPWESRARSKYLTVVPAPEKLVWEMLSVTHVPAFPFPIKRNNIASNRAIFEIEFMEFAKD